MANAIVLAVVFLMLGLAWMADVTGDAVVLFGRRMPEACLYKRMTRRPCVGCGTTRSLVLAVHGRWAQSRARHPAGVWLLAFLLSQAVLRAALLVRRPGAGVAVACLDPIVSAALYLAMFYVPLAL